jgi:hypothetical protein
MKPICPSDAQKGKSNSADPHACETEEQCGHVIGPFRRNRVTQEKTGRTPDGEGNKSQDGGLWAAVPRHVGPPDSRQE